VGRIIIIIITISNHSSDVPEEMMSSNPSIASSQE
jgi:hypothetical protein